MMKSKQWQAKVGSVQVRSLSSFLVLVLLFCFVFLFFPLAWCLKWLACIWNTLYFMSNRQLSSLAGRRIEWIYTRVSKSFSLLMNTTWGSGKYFTLRKFWEFTGNTELNIEDHMDARIHDAVMLLGNTSKQALAFSLSHGTSNRGNPYCCGTVARWGWTVWVCCSPLLISGKPSK